MRDKARNEKSLEDNEDGAEEADVVTDLSTRFEDMNGPNDDDGSFEETYGLSQEFF